VGGEEEVGGEEVGEEEEEGFGEGVFS